MLTGYLANHWMSNIAPQEMGNLLANQDKLGGQSNLYHRLNAPNTNTLIVELLS